MPLFPREPKFRKRFNHGGEEDARAGEKPNQGCRKISRTIPPGKSLKHPPDEVKPDMILFLYFLRALLVVSK